VKELHQLKSKGLGLWNKGSQAVHGETCADVQRTAHIASLFPVVRLH